jgi:hypothetical protein
MKFNKTKKIIATVLIIIAVCFIQNVIAVTSKITSHNTSDDFIKGQTENIIIGSKGTLQLSRTNNIIAKDFEDVWSIKQKMIIKNILPMNISSLWQPTFQEDYWLV